MIGGREPGRLGGGDKTIARRVPFLVLVIVLTFGSFFGRLFQLQLIQTDDLRQRSQRNYVRTMRLEAPRGDILDRLGRVLAQTRAAYGLQIVPNDLREPELIYAALAQLIDRDPESLRQKVGSPRGRRRFQPVRLAGDLSYDQFARVESHLYALPGVFTDRRPRRHYVEASLGAHVLGYIGEIQRAQLEKRAYADYRAGEVIGQAGVESLLQAELRGRAGGRNQVVDVAGRLGRVLDEIEPVPGGSVTLTIDRDLQRAAEAAFLPDVLGERPRLGALVALDVRNGDILALMSKPSFDPNDFAGGIDTETWRQLAENEWRPIQNRAISGQYPPGSTYKAIVAAAALEEGVVDPAKKLYCPGSFRLGRRSYRCWKRAGHGWVDLHRALVESCDVFFYQTGLALSIDRLAFFARGFSLGRRTGLRLPHEQSGLVPTSAWKERRFAEPWVLGETVSAAIGQGFDLVTPLQLAVAFAAIANGGKLVRPRLVLRTEDMDGIIRDGPAPEVRGTVPVAPEHLLRVRKALEGVVNEPRGTGGRARVRGVRVAGKTGTAQVVGLEHTEDLEEDEVTFRQRDHAWFVGYAPADAPEIVVAAILEHGGHGGSAAAPVVQRVLAAYFGEDEMPPDVPRAPSPVLPPAPSPVLPPAPSVPVLPPAPQAPEPETRDARVAALSVEGAALVRD